MGTQNIPKNIPAGSVTPFDWLGDAVNNKPMPSRTQSVAAMAVRIGAGLAFIICVGATAAVIVKAFLLGWGLAW